jgi:hypothetical protein
MTLIIYRNGGELEREHINNEGVIEDRIESLMLVYGGRRSEYTHETIKGENKNEENL